MILPELNAVQCIADYENHLHASNFSSSYVKSTLRHVYNLQKYLITGGNDVLSSTVENIEAYIASLYAEGEKRRNSVEGIYYAIRSFYDYLVKIRARVSSPIAPIIKPRKALYLPRNVLTVKEARKVVQQPDISTDIGIRDRAILETFYSTGIRLSELCNLMIADVDIDKGILSVKQGKYSSDRKVPIGRMACRWIGKYIEVARTKHEKQDSGNYIFLGKRGKRIFKQIVGTLVTDYAVQAGIQKHITPHCLRHSCMSHMVRNGADVFSIQMMLGHSRLDISQRYIRVSIQDVRKMIIKHHPREIYARRINDKISDTHAGGEQSQKHGGLA